ncbi:MAG: TetR/AcrR family transcriptional regulator [Microlunatus sp.]|nr:TetR/AcrR family transcriptional regulator [Microlunatus sp.]
MAEVRRRGEMLDDALLDATVAELTDVGYARLTVESVARRAGAGKMSIYKRWSGKPDLVMAAAYRLFGGSQPPPDRGSLRSDLHAWLRAAADQCDGPAGEALRGIIADAMTAGPGDLLHQLSRGGSLVSARVIIERARARPEKVREGLSDIALATPATLLRFHFLTHGPPIPDDVITAIVDDVALPLFTRA